MKMTMLKNSQVSVFEGRPSDEPRPLRERHVAKGGTYDFSKETANFFRKMKIAVAAEDDAKVLKIGELPNGKKTTFEKPAEPDEDEDDGLEGI